MLGCILISVGCGFLGAGLYAWYQDRNALRYIDWEYKRYLAEGGE